MDSTDREDPESKWDAAESAQKRWDRVITLAAWAGTIVVVALAVLHVLRLAIAIPITVLIFVTWLIYATLRIGR